VWAGVGGSQASDPSGRIFGKKPKLGKEELYKTTSRIVLIILPFEHTKIKKKKY
jgi:hypothetical protein